MSLRATTRSPAGVGVGVRLPTVLSSSSLQAVLASASAAIVYESTFMIVLLRSTTRPVVFGCVDFSAAQQRVCHAEQRFEREHWPERKRSRGAADRVRHACPAAATRRALVRAGVGLRRYLKTTPSE